MKCIGNLRKVLAGLGVLIFLFGVLSSLHRSRIGFAMWQLFMLQPFYSNEIPEFLAWLDCPTQMGVEDAAIVTAVIADRSSSASTQMITLWGADFDIVPPDPVEVHIPEGEEVELSWVITARAVGIHEVNIPVNPWDNHICLIRVIDTQWLSFQEGRVLSLICMLFGSLFVLPRQGTTSLQINKESRREILFSIPALLPAILAVTVNEAIIVDRLNVLYFGLLGLTLLLAAPWVIVWYANTWRLRNRVILSKGKLFLSIGFFTLVFIFALISLSSPVEEISDIKFHLDIFSALFVPLITGTLLLYPWLDPTWDHPWEAVSKSRKAARIFLYLVASPMTLVAFLLALNESLLVFF